MAGAAEHLDFHARYLMMILVSGILWLLKYLSVLRFRPKNKYYKHHQHPYIPTLLGLLIGQ